MNITLGYLYSYLYDRQPTPRGVTSKAGRHVLADAITTSTREVLPINRCLFSPDNASLQIFLQLRWPEPVIHYGERQPGKCGSLA